MDVNNAGCEATNQHQTDDNKHSTLGSKRCTVASDHSCRTKDTCCNKVHLTVVQTESMHTPPLNCSMAPRNLCLQRNKALN